MVDRGGVFHNHEIEPAAATTSTGGYAEFSTDFLELGTGLAEVLGWEGTSSYTGSVCFYDADDRADLGWVECETSEDSAKTSVGGCNIRECSIIDVEHDGVGAFDEHWGVRRLRRGDKRNSVNHKGY